MQDGPRIKEKKMTGFDMPEWARRAALARHGCEHPFGALDPARTALVVIDMQNGFMVREGAARSEEHTSELQSLMRISYAVFRLKKKKSHTRPQTQSVPH